MKNLVIVESPAKAKTIEGYLGKDFTVKSSMGHIRDLKKGNDAVLVEKDFEPVYVISDDKKQIVNELKKLAKSAEKVWLATDDDREGEAISWHLTEALGLDPTKPNRIVFREITKNAILKAIQNPRPIDMDLVNAQQARRILDRLVGFEISPILWKKIKNGLSAGRVQSVAVRLIVEREREIEKFVPTSSYRIRAVFQLPNNKKLIAELPKHFETSQSAEFFLQKCLGAIFSIENLETKPGKKSPAPPFTTSTLQQEASRKLGFSVAQTMAIAQKLYESGKITYMRTDSVNLSEEALMAAATTIEREFGKHFLQTRRYKTKSETAQEAHEAIRPTYFENATIEGERNEQRLYELIWKRTIASQMADAQIEKTIATIGISTTPEKLIASGEVIKFEGFLKVYIESTDEEPEDDENSELSFNKGMLPPLKIGQILLLDHMKATERFSRPPARYTEASLVKKLEEMGIGRPSTYAPTISTIQQREYVIKESREGKERKYTEYTLANNVIKKEIKTEITGTEKAKLFPTNMGIVVNDFLVKYFPSIVDYHFTANVEEEFDKIANGRIDWRDMLRKFYETFHKTVEETEHSVDRNAAGSIRFLGVEPTTGKNVYVKLGRYGAYVQIGDNEDEDKKFASLRKGQFIEHITLEEAIELFKLPRYIGDFEEKPITANIGRFGPYISHDNKFYSLPKDIDPFLVDVQTAISIIHSKREADANKILKTFCEDKDLQILNGRWGPYISYKKENYKIPKDKNALELTYGECISIIEATPKKKKNADKTSPTKAKKLSKKLSANEKE
ncbi:MAG: type I DNA topoisomerase [Cytophagales bacterium]|nr:type I DNA topoisomerase [Cytophagales bacterium]MDW8383408.1 type I DNA topoisomerase [Flammeovirgaceae bacterium]